MRSQTLYVFIKNFAIADIFFFCFLGSGSASPVGKPVDLAPPHLPDSPNSSSPSTPEDHSYRASHRRTDTVKIEGEDYFIAQNKYGTDSRSASITPSPVPVKSIVFSPRIQFHETWPSGEYDRRGETATCNKLTPLLAQQIKEELNTFKMVCLKRSNFYDTRV